MMRRLGKYFFLACATLASSLSYALPHGSSNPNANVSHQRDYSARGPFEQHNNKPMQSLAKSEKDDKVRGKNWEELTDKQKKRIQRKREEFDALPPQEKERIRSAREKYRQLPDDRRNELRKKWRDMTPEERARFGRHKKDN